MGEVAVNHERVVPPAWLLVSQAFPEIQGAAKQETARALGGIAIRGEQAERYSPDLNHASTLMTATQEAALGDPEARQVIENNVEADVIERLFKVKSVACISMKVSGHKFRQSNRELTDIHRNTLENTVLIPEMLRCTTHEFTNAHIFGQLHEAGLFKWFDALVFATTSTKMSQREKHDYGRFVDTESCSVQLLSVQGEGAEEEAILETALVAGKRTKDGPRHDIDTIRKLAASKGIELPTDDGTDIVSCIMLVPKGDMNGVVDAVAAYDEAAGGTFYGLDEPRQDYQEHARQFLERAKQFDDIVQSITEQLIREAPAFTSPLEAIMRLDELSGRRCIDKAVEDKSLNAHIFGPRAALHIQEARFFSERGDQARAEKATIAAKKADTSRSCPLFKLQEETDSPKDSDTTPANEEKSKKKWMNCPHCSAKVYDDPCAKRLSCWDCKASVVNGRTVSTGNGGSQKQIESWRAAFRSGSIMLKEVLNVPSPDKEPVAAITADRE